jgi:MFS family permease
MPSANIATVAGHSGTTMQCHPAMPDGRPTTDITYMTASLFKNRLFARYISGLCFSYFAYNMLVVAIGWHIYDLTNSALSLGLIGLAQFLPQFLLSLAAGHVADRYDRKAIVSICQFIQGLMALVLAAGSYAGWMSSELIYACAFVIGAARAFYSPATQALLPALVERDILPKAISFSSAARNAAAIAGPALGGVIYLLGAGTAYATSGILFVAASVLVATIRLPFVAPHREPATLKSVFAGFVYIRNNPVIMGAISLDLFAVLLSSATALLPIYARDILETGPWGLGILRAAPAAGATIAAAIMVRIALTRRVGHILFISVALFGVASIVFGVSTSFPLSVAALVILGAADMVSVLIRSSLVQLDTPDQMLGRVSAVNSIFIGTSNQLGQFQAGVVAAIIGTVPAVVVGGIGTLLVAALWMRLFPTLVKRDSLAAPGGGS